MQVYTTSLINEEGNCFEAVVIFDSTESENIIHKIESKEIVDLDHKKEIQEIIDKEFPKSTSFFSYDNYFQDAGVSHSDFV